MVIELKRLSCNDGIEIYNMLQEIPKEENGLQNKANGLTFEEFKEWLIIKQAESKTRRSCGWVESSIDNLLVIC